MSACVARGPVAKFSDLKVSNHSNLKILTAKQLLHILPIAVAQVRAGNTSEALLNEVRQIIYFCIDWKKLLKTYITMQLILKSYKTEKTYITIQLILKSYKTEWLIYLYEFYI